MERDNPNVTQPAADPVDETLERLEVADTLEDLRHHIDDLIARLSAQEQAVVPAAGRTPPGDLEGQLENLGGKVESASDLLAELADLLEAQTERIETIEQQLGDPDFAFGPSQALAKGDVPRFTMRPAHGAQGSPPAEEPHTHPVSGAQGRRAPSRSEPETQTEAVEAIRRYLETRFERLETAIHDVDKRIVEMRMVADERERYVRDLEERLLLLVGIATARPTPEDDADAVEIRTGEDRRGEAREAGDLDLVGYLPPRPAHMPAFAHDAARARRKLVRRAGIISPPTVPALRRGLRATAEAEMPPVVSLMREVGTDSPGVASHATSGRLAVVDVRAEPAATSAEQDSITEARVEPPRPVLRSGIASATRATTAGSSTRSREQSEAIVPSGVRELEKLVERDVSLRRDFRSKPGDTVRPAKAHPTVMVVDDAPDALTVLSIYLSKTGYQVVTATSAEDCLAKLRHHAIDAIVLDAKLSGASGEHVCRVLREDPAYAHRRDVPVIVYTGYPDDFPAEVRDEWKADDYVVKGGDMLPLMRALVRHTSREATT